MFTLFSTLQLFFLYFLSFERNYFRKTSTQFCVNSFILLCQVRKYISMICSSENRMKETSLLCQFLAHIATEIKNFWWFIICYKPTNWLKWPSFPCRINYLWLVKKIWLSVEENFFFSFIYVILYFMYAIFSMFKISCFFFQVFLLFFSLLICILYLLLNSWFFCYTHFILVSSC